MKQRTRHALALLTLLGALPLQAAESAATRAVPNVSHRPNRAVVSISPASCCR